MPDKRIAVYPGSFDPIHSGHLQVIKQAAGLFDKLVVLVAKNPGKSGQQSFSTRVELAKYAIEQFPIVEPCEITVECTDKSLADYCKARDIKFVVRGLRNGVDLEYEETQKYFVNKMDARLTYVFLTVPPLYRALSSSALREFAKIATPEQFFYAYWPGAQICLRTNAYHSVIDERIYNIYHGDKK